MNPEGAEIEDDNDEYNINTNLDGPGQSQRGGWEIESGVTSTLTIKFMNEPDLEVANYTCIMDGTDIKGTIKLSILKGLYFIWTSL